MIETIKASNTPQRHLELIAYPNQEPRMRKFHPGYSNYISSLPVLQEGPMLKPDILLTDTILGMLSTELTTNDMAWLNSDDPGVNSFNRNILSMAEPELRFESYGTVVEGTGPEIFVAKWGQGFTSPIHGHPKGIHYEELLLGRILVNTYRLMGGDTVRLAETYIMEPGQKEMHYIPNDDKTMVHNYKALEFSASLHFQPEHARDGRGNGYNPQYFEDSYNFLNEDLVQISSREGFYLRKGDVVLVRSSNVPEYGDHYIIVTGEPVKKPHGMRVKQTSISAPHASHILDSYSRSYEDTGVTLLKLSHDAKQDFFLYHDIKMISGEVVMHG